MGSGRVVFDRASEGLRTWRAHGVPGVRVFPDGESLNVGDSVIVTLGMSRVSVAAPCRVIELIEGPTRWGFVYATLPGHPERGEEAFVVSIDDEGDVKFQITAISQPGDRLTRLAGPLGRGVQLIATIGYLKALRAFVHSSTR